MYYAAASASTTETAAISSLPRVCSVHISIRAGVNIFTAHAQLGDQLDDSVREICFAIIANFPRYSVSFVCTFSDITGVIVISD